MIYKLLRSILVIVIVVVVLCAFSNSYISHTIDNIVHVVAIGVDKCDDNKNNMKVSFQFVDVSSVGENSSGEGESTIITSINSTTINKAINLMNSYIGKQLNFSHCKIIVISEEFAKNGIATEISTFINNQEIRPSTNLIISTCDANTYIKNSNPNIEKLVTNYYDTFDLTSNFTGYSDDISIGKFYNELFNYSRSNTAILGRLLEEPSSESNPQEGKQDSSNEEGKSSGNDSQTDSSSNGSGGNSEQQSSQNNSQSQASQDKSQGQQSQDSNQSENSQGILLDDGNSLEISGKRKTANVGIAVFKNDKYVGQLSEIDSICHLVITNNIDSFIISIPMENYTHNLLDINVSPVSKSKIKVDISSEYPTISIFICCEAKILTIDTTSNYNDPKVLQEISQKAKQYLKTHIETYLNKTSKEFNSDIADFGKHALNKFLTIDDWENYKWNSKYSNANFNVDVDINVTSSLLFLGEQ